MASHHAIAAISQTILRLLDDAAQAEPDFASASFELAAKPDDLKMPTEGLGAYLFLYRVSANTARRNLPPRRQPDGTRTRPPLPLDLSYLLCPWASEPDTQHRLLGWVMRTLEDTPILPASLLNAHPGSPDPKTFRGDETVELVYDPLSLQDLATLWELLKPRIQASATYVARMVAIDSMVRVPDGEVVQTRDFGYGTVELVPVGGRP